MRTKRLTKYLIDKYRLVNDIKYFSSNVLQSYVAFISANRYFKLFNGKY